MARPKRIIPTVKRKPLADKVREVMLAFLLNVAMPKKMDLDDWADEYRQLPQETSSEHGQWSTDRFPFLRRIMKVLSPSSPAKEIIVQKGAQLGFTELAINWMLYTADHDPGPLLYCQKSEVAAQDFSNQKLKPSIKATEKVFDVLGKGKPKSLSDSWSDKGFPGGFLSIGGANVPEFLKSKSTGRACTDEEDSYDAGIGKDGSPVAMIRKRMVNFPNRKLYRPSTPQLTETSTIEPAFEGGSQEYYYVPCPHCNALGADDGFMFVLHWSHIKYSKELTIDGLPVETWCECPNCAGRIEEDLHKTWMLAEGDWFSTKGSENGERYRVDEDCLKPSYHISSFYSPLGFFGWADAVEEWFDYLKTKDVHLLQVIVNQTWAETFTMTGREISYDHLFKRREEYSVVGEAIDVPAQGLVLTCGVDIQGDRIEAFVMAHGLYDECWAVDYAVLVGDPGQLGDKNGFLADGRPSVWMLLDQYLMKQWRHESGQMLPIECTMIDGQYKTDEVNVFCRLREHRRVFVIHGKDGWGRPTVTAKRRRHERFGTINYQAGVDMLKSKLVSQLKINEVGPGFVHFPVKECFSKEYFKGLTCETLKKKIVKGQEVLYWANPVGVRNEPTDLWDYAKAAFHAYPVDLPQRADRSTPLPQTAATQPRRRRKRRGSPGL